MKNYNLKKISSVFSVPHKNGFTVQATVCSGSYFTTFVLLDPFDQSHKTFEKDPQKLRRRISEKGVIDVALWEAVETVDYGELERQFHYNMEF